MKYMNDVHWPKMIKKMLYLLLSLSLHKPESTLHRWLNETLHHPAQAGILLNSDVKQVK